MSVTADLFGDQRATKLGQESLSPGAVVLRGFAIRNDAVLLREIRTVIAHAPLRHMQTPGGLRMSVAMTNCGALGWLSDATGYRYATADPDSGLRWPAMPDAFVELAANAASRAGFDAFRPDACLINRYEPGARLTLHQDKNERDFSAPIVSVSLGLPALFLFGGPKRNDKTLRVPLFHGDVVVWGGPSRLRYHGVSRLKEGAHTLLGACRFNLTFRKAA